MTDLPSTMLGMKVHVSNTLPIIPTVEHEAKWIVQQGFARTYRDFTRWYREPLVKEPKPTHAFVARGMDGSHLFVSRKLYHILRTHGTNPLTHDRESLAAQDEIWRARNNQQLSDDGVVHFG